MTAVPEKRCQGMNGSEGCCPAQKFNQRLRLSIRQTRQGVALSLVNVLPDQPDGSFTPRGQNKFMDASVAFIAASLNKASRDQRRQRL
jgi:hypothetical protein